MLLLPGAARAAGFNVPAGTLGEAVATLGVQARVTIVLADLDLAGARTGGVQGRMSLRTAVATLLRGTGAEAVFQGPALVRIRRVAVKTSGPSRPKGDVPHVPPPPVTGPDILVEASKQRISVKSYPGAVKVVTADDGWLDAHAAEGSTALTRILPSLGATNLGNGRNKLFIRGIADSSFSGPTQAITGQYLGDIRLTYSAPDPDLNLYDMKHFEVLAGPQGTLYGAGSLGGIIRLVPEPPDPSRWSGSFSANLGATRHGDFGVDGAVMVNAPLAEGRVAVRFVGFSGHMAGYIDAPDRGARNINGTTSYGQRFSLLARDLGPWTLETGFVAQNIATGDGQYVLRGEPAFTRSGIIAQPFSNDYRLGYLSIKRSFGGVEVTSVTSLARHNLSTTFDATGYDGSQEPAVYGEHNDIHLLSHETRASGGGTDAPWVAGMALTSSSTRLGLALRDPREAERHARTRSDQMEAAAFAQGNLSLADRLTLSLGGRLTFAASSRSFSGEGEMQRIDPRHQEWRFAGTLGLNWRVAGDISTFYHLQQGYRPGGLGLSLSPEGFGLSQFVSDELRMHEFGVRWGDRSRSSFWGQATLFTADWRNIQADLVAQFGVPYTANIGRGIVRGLDMEVNWKPFPSATIGMAAFLNRSHLARVASEFSDANPGYDAVGAALPNVARNGMRFFTSWRRELGEGVLMNVEVSARYVGASRLGIGPLLDISQGQYLVADVGLRLSKKRWTLFLSVLNAGDANGNTFSYGNPFGLPRGDQITPLRPRTIRVGLQKQF